MKALLRSSIFAVIVFAGYAAFSAEKTSPIVGIGTTPTCGGGTRPQASLCVK